MSIDQAERELLRTSNFGIDLSNIRNLHDLFNYKEKAVGLDEKEMKLR